MHCVTILTGHCYKFKANPEVSYYVSLKSLAYFMVAPTLCYQVMRCVFCEEHQPFLISYTCKSLLSKPRVLTFSQPSYPRSPCIRKGWVARQFAKLVIFTGFMGFIIEQVRFQHLALLFFLGNNHHPCVVTT